MKKYLLLPHLKIHNANAISSNYIIGFPALPAWLGGVHALERKIKCCAGLAEVSFGGTGIVVHGYKIHSHRLKGNPNYSLAITANPLKKKGKDFERPPIIPEGRIDMDVSLVIDVTGVDVVQESDLVAAVKQILPVMRLASGDIMNMSDTLNITIHHIDDDEAKQYRELVSELMPGYAILERRELLLESGGAEDYDVIDAVNEHDAMDDLLNLLQVNEVAELDDNKKIVKWSRSRSKAGWLVPIAVGYKALSTAGKLSEQRDGSYEHQFAESIVTIGEFKALHRIRNIDELMWHYKCTNNLYVCVNQNI